MSRVLFAPQVQSYFNELIPLLYELEYFGRLDDSRKYVKELFDQIVATLPSKLHKPAPPHFERFGKGMHYATFRRNRQTTWYVFFALYHHGGEPILLVRYIATNHSVAQYLL